jgi:hypothetical protein
MDSDAARAKMLLSRRSFGRKETFWLSLAALGLTLGAAAWIGYGEEATSFASAALPPGGQALSFQDRFQAPLASETSREFAVKLINPLQLKLRDAKAMLADQLGKTDWRASILEDERGAADTSRTSQRTEIPMPRSRPVEADLASQVATSQAFAATLPKGDNRNLLQRFSDILPSNIKLASLTPDSGLFRQAPDLGALGYDSQTAVYDISAKAVYLPSGVALEAHSGMGDLMDDPGHVDQRMVGATPPATYELKPREKLFHGVRALRMNPVDGTSALGRVGLLTHSYMLGPRGDSNGCVSIRFYDRFLKAYDDGEITRLVVVPSLKGATSLSQRASNSSS